MTAVTVDPVTRSREAESPARRLVPVVEILFHPDLDRVGEITPFDLLEDGRPVVFGREGPGFLDARWATERPLADPCVSRRQVVVRWRADAARFAVEPCSDARRPVRCLRLDGAPASPGPDVPPGTLVAIGDRVLLLLALRRARRPEADRLGMVGESETLWALREQIRSIARSGSDVLIEGETGVGKELVARAIHAAAGGRGPLVPVNCAALSDALFESELFGHRRGAFTGAASDAPGLFRAAAGGTIFLDEIGELPLPAQAKLLRVLQERAVKPVGDTREYPVDVRVVAATLRDLAADVASGRFRADLYARLEAPRLVVPPLRDRREDIPRLFLHFLRAQPGADLARLWRPADERDPPVPMDFFLGLLAAPWERNVRQLEKFAVTTAHANAHPGRFTAPPLPAAAAAPPAPEATATRAPLDPAALQAALERHDYNQHRVAAELGIARSTLHRWMEQHGFRRPRDLTRAEILEALQATGGDIAAAAARFRVSPRGLQLRMRALGVAVAHALDPDA